MQTELLHTTSPPYIFQPAASANRKYESLSRACHNTDWLVAKPFNRGNAKPQEQRQNNKLRDQEGRLFLVRSQRFQGRHFLECLDYRDEHIKVEGNYCADHVNPTPRASQMKAVACQDRKPQHHERYQTDLMGRQEVVEWKQEAGYAGRNWGR